MIESDLGHYYQTNFALMQFHNYSLSDLENMIPFERDIYVSLVDEYVKSENLRNLENQSKN